MAAGGRTAAIGPRGSCTGGVSTLCRVAIRPILIVGDPRLAAPARVVTEFDDELAGFVEDLFETNTAANGAGLAANQVGDPRAVFVYDLVDGGVRHRGHVVNPVLETSELPETMPDPDDDLEGCLSVPGEWYPTGRASWAKVTGVDISGAPVEVEATTGFLARCLQHETDHLLSGAATSFGSICAGQTLAVCR